MTVVIVTARDALIPALGMRKRRKERDATNSRPFIGVVLGQFIQVGQSFLGIFERGELIKSGETVFRLRSTEDS